MAPSTPRLRILSVGGNAVSAFLSWRLQATNACDVTLVWKSGYEAVAQYGISFRSKLFGNERFKPRRVVKSPEDAAGAKAGAFDYVLLCVKALPDVYDLSAVIESVVTPQHTCILINTTHTVGIESYLESRFPTNVVLSLVSGAEIVQLGASEFEHTGATDVWVGPANKNPSIPAAIQSDMAEALAMTLTTAQVDCKVSTNIRQQQFERMIGPIAFHPASVLFEAPKHSELSQKVGVHSLISETMDEVIRIAISQGCSFPDGFKERTMDAMLRPADSNSIMYQDFTAKRPMEIETYLGAPMKMGTEAGVPTPRISTLYAMLHHKNIINQIRTEQQPTSHVAASGPVHRPGPPQARGPPGGPLTNGHMPQRPGGQNPQMNGAPPPMRRGPPLMNGYPPRLSNGNTYSPARGPPGAPPRRPSFEANGLEEFSHVMLYDNMPEGGVQDGRGVYGDSPQPVPADLVLRERELAIRQKELALREQEYNMRRSRGGRNMEAPSQIDGFDDDDDDDDFFPIGNGPGQPQIDPDNFDMMSVTSRRTRRAPSASQLRKNPEAQTQSGRRGNLFPRPTANRNRASARLMDDMPALRESLMNNPLMGYSSDRYGNVDRQAIGRESRTNSLTAARLDELQQGPLYGGYGPVGMGPRRTSQSPGNPLNTNLRNGSRPSPPNGPNGHPSNGHPPNGHPPNGHPPNGHPPNGHPSNGHARNGHPLNGMPPTKRPSPPGVRQPTPRHPPGHGNAVAPQQVEQHVGVSSLYPPKSGPQVRSLTGSASASAGSGDSGASGQLDSEPSAHSSSSSLGPRHTIGVR